MSKEFTDDKINIAYQEMLEEQKLSDKGLGIHQSLIIKDPGVDIPNVTMDHKFLRDVTLRLNELGYDIPGNEEEWRKIIEDSVRKELEMEI